MKQEPLQAYYNIGVSKKPIPTDKIENPAEINFEEITIYKEKQLLSDLINRSYKSVDGWLPLGKSKLHPDLKNLNLVEKLEKLGLLIDYKGSFYPTLKLVLAHEAMLLKKVTD